MNYGTVLALTNDNELDNFNNNIDLIKVKKLLNNMTSEIIEYQETDCWWFPSAENCADQGGDSVDPFVSPQNDDSDNNDGDNQQDDVDQGNSDDPNEDANSDDGSGFNNGNVDNENDSDQNYDSDADSDNDGGDTST